MDKRYLISFSYDPMKGIRRQETTIVSSDTMKAAIAEAEALPYADISIESAVKVDTQISFAYAVLPADDANNYIKRLLSTVTQCGFDTVKEAIGEAEILLRNIEAEDKINLDMTKIVVERNDNKERHEFIYRSEDYECDI